jgi:hypothetical protein
MRKEDITLPKAHNVATDSKGFKKMKCQIKKFKRIILKINKF